MSATTDLASFFQVDEFDSATITNWADRIFASAKARDSFGDTLAAYRTATEAGNGDWQRLGVADFLLCHFSDALTAFGKSRAGKFKHFYTAETLVALGRYDEALDEYKKAASAGWDALDCDVRSADALLRAENLAGAEKLIQKHERAGADRPEWLCVRGELAERQGDRDAAIEYYEKALTLDPDYVQAMFRLAWLRDLLGDDDAAVELYERCALQPRAAVNALINLAVVYEDRGRYDHAANCLLRVLMAFPNHTRANLFLKDVESSRTMVIDDNVEQKLETRNRLLETPVAEFELSVRARNCLKKMKINTLGELLKLSEPELMAYKNFGETSLTEIKALLAKRGLRLGQKPEEIDPSMLSAPPPVTTPKVVVPPGSESSLGKPVSEMELSVRARRCLQRLNITTMGDLIQRSEAELLATRNFGVTSLNEIKSRLADFGLTLAPRS